MDLTQWKTRELAKIKDDLDLLFDDVCRQFGVEAPHLLAETFSVAETDAALLIRAAIPDLDPDHVEITVSDEVLRIAGRSVRRSRSGPAALVEERRFEKSYRLPCTIEPGAVEARYSEGVLTIVLPKCAPRRAARVRIVTG